MKSLSKYSSVNVHLIPNSVNKVKCDSSRINRFKEEFKVRETDHLEEKTERSKE